MYKVIKCICRSATYSCLHPNPHCSKQEDERFNLMGILEETLIRQRCFHIKCEGYISSFLKAKLM